MKKFYIFRKLVLSLVALAISGVGLSQLPNGSIAPNWTMTDINGNSHTLYNYLAQGKKVVIDVSAVWCAPCWSYHQSGALENLYNQYGPTGSVNQTMMVFFIEGDENPLACLQGTGCSTQGNWVTGTPYPMFLTNAPPAGNGNSVVGNYDIAYFPTVYTVCPDHTIYESGQKTTSQHYSYANSTCAPLSTNTNDAKAFACTVPSVVYCVGNVTPGFTLQNYGTAALTSCDITVNADGSPVQSFTWTGNLAMYDVATVSLNQITGLSNGSHTISVVVSNPNGSTDEDPSNNSVSKTLNVMTVPVSIPVSQDYSSSTFPPTNYSISDNPSDGYNWKRSSTAGHTASGSMYIEFYSISQGNTDDFSFPLLDFTNYTSPTLTFWMAHRRYSTTYTDKLEVDVSSNCGQTWTQKWVKSGAALATNPTALTSEYLSPIATDWRLETIDLLSYQGMSNIMIRFRATSGYGNNCFVDDINITGISGLNNNQLYDNISLYPNPSSGMFYITNAENSVIELTDILGKVVLKGNISANNEQVNLSNLPDGSYILRISKTEGTVVKNIVLVK